MNGQEVTKIKPNTIIGEDYNGWINLSDWKDSEEESDDTIKTHIIGESVDYIYILSQAQFDSIKFLKENSELVRNSLLNGLLKEYRKAKEIYEDSMPEIKTISDYKDNLNISYLHIMDSEKDNLAYTGFELECSWDDEHGVGVMMHKDKVVKIGLAEESFNHWNCYEDNGTSDYEQIKWEKANKLIKEHQKKWWEFWK